MVAFSLFTNTLRPCLNQGILIPLNHFGKGRKKAVALVRCASTSESHIVKSSRPPIELPQVLLHDYVFRNISAWEHKVALECAVTGKKITYKDFYKFSKNLALALQKKFKLKKGDCQFVMLPNCIEFPCIFMAGSLTGVLTTTSNPLYTPYEITHHVKVTQPKLIFTMPDMYENLVEVFDKLNLKLPTIMVRSNPDSSLPPGTVDFLEIAQSGNPGPLDPVDLTPEDSVVLPFSSGTGGLPKGVELTHRNVTSQMFQISDAFFFKIISDKENNQCVTLAILPMFHIYGMACVTLEGLSAGDRLIVVPKYEPKLLLDTIYLKKPGLLYIVPPLVFFLAHHPIVERKHLQRVHSVVTGAAACGAVDSKALVNKAPHIVMCQGYGMTETSPVVTFTEKGRAHKYDSVGHPINLTQVKVVDLKTGDSLPKGLKGEICVKGPQVMKGYYNLPEVTKSAFDSEGWLKTGDIGYYDEEHDFYVSDRIKELIKVKGFQVAPAELEETLRGHPKVYDVGVVGVPDPNLGEAPKAFIAVKPGATMTEKEALEHVEKHLAPHKHLKGGVQFINAIPRSSAGKVLRRKLIEIHNISTPD